MKLNTMIFLYLFILTGPSQAAYEGYDCLALKRTAVAWASKLNSSNVQLTNAKAELKSVDAALKAEQVKQSSTLDSLNLVNSQIEAWADVAENNPKYEIIFKSFKALLTRVDVNVPEILEEIEELKVEIKYEKENMDPALYVDLIKSLESQQKSLEDFTYDNPEGENELEFLKYLRQINERKVNADLQLTALEEERNKIESRYKIESDRVNNLVSQQQQLLNSKRSHKTTKIQSRVKFEEVKVVRDKICKMESRRAEPKIHAHGFPHL